MLEVGQIIQINGKVGEICFLAEYESNKYTNICFHNNELLEFKIYKYTINENSFHFVLETDEKTLANLMAIFTQEVIGE